ncbi:omega-3 polyunsaturated fatty acid synthase PfaB [Shewanella denitrificans OS217]|uniref:Omega-3 polyunsaturated fatty acid synthase PfaB n=1 Tax=Shewanella denitrificans (strain OS217 / ATCC BAA-1090 / DSM 15013) TaxID=318161 RepID=Q12KW9_SHEDO|nr:PfaB family protein [Shewanella denitrificans]ABE55907.1 omega-3 polyunsaturated fatty acid synthase PfaB [Shewanella denitrificans OS217]
MNLTPHVATDGMLAVVKPLSVSQLVDAVKARQTLPLRIAVLLTEPSLLGADIQLVTVDNSHPLAFEQALATAAQILSTTDLSTNTSNVIVNLADTLWLMPALTAAKNALHPHAYINGVGIAANSHDAITQALVHAKRTHLAPKVQQVSSACSNDKLQGLKALVTAIAQRQSLDSGGYWFCDFHQSRVAAFSNSFTNTSAGTSISTRKASSKASDDSHQAIILTQGTAVIAAKPLLNQHRLWLPLGATSMDDLQQGLIDLSQHLTGLDTPLALLNFIKQALSKYQANSAIYPLTAVVMATSFDALKAEVNAMEQFIKASEPKAPISYKTPAGSCFTNQPSGEAGLSFVYPGVGTVYADMFKHLGHSFPALYAELEKQGDLQAMLQNQHIYASADQKSAANSNDTSPIGVAGMSLSQLAIAGVGASYLLTKLLDKEFNIKPKLALGYSMGEASMWASLNVWQQPHSLIEATQSSTIFTQDISGALNCVRKDWQLTHTDGQADEIVWNSFVTRATPEELTPHLKDFPRAYIAIIQGDTCVIAGCEASCKAMLKQAGKRGMASNKVTAMHTPPAMQIIEQVKQFYHQTLMDKLPTSITFLTATQDKPIPLNSDAIAQSIADTFCHQLDFTQLIAKACHHGSRLFVEIGADRQTSTLIDKILASQAPLQDINNHPSPAHAIAINAKGADESISLLKCLAQLLSHRVSMSFAPFVDSIEQAIECLSLGLDADLQQAAAHLISEGEPH